MRRLLSCGLLLSSGLAGAAPVVETVDRLEINWSTLRIRFYGEASSSASQGEELKSAEKKAWQDGLAYIQGAVRDLNVSVNERGEASDEQITADAKEAAKAIAKSTSSYSTTYFANGTVRVLLENQLPKALSMAGIRFRQREPATHGALEHTGIVLKTAKAMKPSARYLVVDENGETLFDVHEMAEEAYRKSLMGRWLKRPSSSELAETVGKNPAVVAAEPIADGKLRVARSAWEQAVDGHRALLVNGTIAVVLP
jgi:hypothetical protein